LRIQIQVGTVAAINRPWLPAEGNRVGWEAHISPYRDWVVQITKEEITPDDIYKKPAWSANNATNNNSISVGEANQQQRTPVGEANGWGEPDSVEYKRNRTPVGEANGWGEPDSVEYKRNRTPVGEANGWGEPDSVEYKRNRTPVGEANGWGEPDSVEYKRNRTPVGEANGWGEPDSIRNKEANSAFEESEAALERAWKATRALFRQAYQISRIEIVGRAGMLYINRRETGAVDSDVRFIANRRSRRCGDISINSSGYCGIFDGRKRSESDPNTIQPADSRGN
jgi:hypothetical protein